MCMKQKNLIIYIGWGGPEGPWPVKPLLLEWFRRGTATGTMNPVRTKTGLRSWRNSRPKLRITPYSAAPPRSR